MRKEPEAGKRRCAVREPSGPTLTREQIGDYMEKLRKAGYSPSTLECYRRMLGQLYLFLPEGKSIREGTLEAWQEALLESGCSPRTVNIGTAAANGLMAHLGRRGLQAGRLPEEGDGASPELTRAEYLRLLGAARMQGKERKYLLVKVFGTIGIAVGELPKLTVESVREGELALDAGALRIPAGLRRELESFIREEGTVSGPVFLTKTGKPQGRTSITVMIQALSRDARVPEEKATPRCLKKLCQATQAGIREELALLADQTYERLLEKEQRAFGWEK